jgi:hypothetical protein
MRTEVRTIGLDLAKKATIQEPAGAPSTLLPGSVFARLTWPERCASLLIL